MDDVVMSVDEGHCQRYGELLADEISDSFQIVVATHDEAWGHDLVREDIVKAGNKEEFSGWSLEDGPRS